MQLFFTTSTVFQPILTKNIVSCSLHGKDSKVGEVNNVLLRNPPGNRKDVWKPKTLKAILSSWMFMKYKDFEISHWVQKGNYASDKEIEWLLSAVS